MWEITRDLGHDTEVGLARLRGDTRDVLPSRRGVGRQEAGRDPICQPPRFEFRLLDEDGVVHFTGWFDEGSVQFIEPGVGSLEELWGFGMRDTGATDLEIKRYVAIRFGYWRDNMGGDEWVSIFG